jgi:hypothetical protein
MRPAQRLGMQCKDHVDKQNVRLPTIDPRQKQYLTLAPQVARISSPCTSANASSRMRRPNADMPKPQMLLMPTGALVDVDTSLAISFPLPPEGLLISEPCTTLLFFLAMPLLFKCLELLLG